MSENSYDNLIQVIYEESGYPSDFCISSDNERVRLAVESINCDRMADEIAELREALESLCEPAFKYSDFVRNAPSLAEFSEKIKRDVKKAHNLLNK